MFYGWRVVGGAFIAQLFVIGFFTYGASLLVAPVRAEFDVSLEKVMYSFTFGTFLGLFLSPIAGIMLDRYPVRWLMAIGSVCFAGGLWLLASSRTLTEYVLVFGVTLAVVNGFASSVSASTVISRWFTVSRGRALGIAALGTSVGGIIVPRLLGMGITDLGWREALQWLSLSVVFVMLPLVVLLVRGRPEEVGLTPESDGAGDGAALAEEPLSTSDVLRNRDFWFMGLCLGLLFSAYSATLANLGPYAQNLGHNQDAASSLIIAVAIAGFVGKLVFGALADKVNLKMALAGAQLLVLAGLLLLSIEPAYSSILAATVCIGLAAGGMLPVWGALTAKIFGLLSYGRVMGLTGPIITLCVLPGFAIVGRLYDESGSYSHAMQLLAFLMVLSAMLLLPLRLDSARSRAA